MDVNNFKDRQYYKFCFYGFLKNLRFFDPFLILYLLQTGINYFHIGILYSIRQITVNIFEIPSGIIADSFGRKKSMLLALSSYISSFLFFYLFSSFYFISFGMILFGIGEAFRSGTHKAMILYYLKKNNITKIKTKYYGSTRSCSQLGSALSAFIAMFIAVFSPQLRIIFLASILPYFINLILIATYPNYLDGKIKDIKLNNILKIIKKSFTDLFKEFKNPITFRGILSAAVFTAVYKSTKDYLQPLIKSLALSLPIFLYINEDKRTSVLVGLIYTLLFIINSFASKNSYKVENIFKNQIKAINYTYLIGVAFVGISGLLLKLDAVIISIILFIGIYVIQNIRKPLTVSYLGSIIPSKIMASGLSAESQLETIIIIIFAPIFGFIADSFNLSSAFIFTGIFYIVIYSLIEIKQ